MRTEKSYKDHEHNSSDQSISHGSSLKDSTSSHDQGRVTMKVSLSAIISYHSYLPAPGFVSPSIKLSQVGNQKLAQRHI
jgi:hypothetical protein